MKHRVHLHVAHDIVEVGMGSKPKLVVASGGPLNLDVPIPIVKSSSGIYNKPKTHCNLRSVMSTDSADITKRRRVRFSKELVSEVRLRPRLNREDIPIFHYSAVDFRRMKREYLCYGLDYEAEECKIDEVMENPLYFCCQ